jgi:cobalt/nickel transport system ATP-binding protein
MNALEITNLNFIYPDGTKALSEISFRMLPGECIALLGPNGSGKSTLMLHLNGLLPEKLSGDTIKVFGDAVITENLPQIRRQVGMVFQDPDDQLFCPTVAEDVAFGPQQLGLSPAEVKQRVTHQLDQVGLAGFENRATHRLSHGEKRRACLAGVLACEPQLLVLDEPTSDLDPRGRRGFKALLRTMPATKIIATHDLEMAVELCSRAIILNRGRMVADGPTRELLADEALMWENGLETPQVLLRPGG